MIGTWTEWIFKLIFQSHEKARGLYQQCPSRMRGLSCPKLRKNGIFETKIVGFQYRTRFAKHPWEMKHRYVSRKQLRPWTRFSAWKFRCLMWVIFSLVLPPGLAGYTGRDLGREHDRLDAIYVIGMRHCEQRWKHIKTWALRENIDVTPLYATRFDEIDLYNPPIPIVSVPQNDVVSAGQVACTYSHIRAWRDAFRKNYTQVIVMEDDVHLTRSLIKRLPRVLGDAHMGSIQRNNMHWHFIFLRFHPTSALVSREKWFGSLTRAAPGWGSAAYILSGSGIRFLLTRITSYSFPLDVQLERFQRGKDTMNSEFVVLDACIKFKDGKSSPGCPENVRELPNELRGNCVFHGSQLGSRVQGREMPGST